MDRAVAPDQANKEAGQRPAVPEQTESHMADVETSKMNTYEGMFLLDAGKTFEAACEPINAILERSGAEILVAKPWDERRLAYEIKGRKRGLYVLVYFKMDPQNVTELENDAQLSDEILRMLVIRKDDLTDEAMNAETPATSSASGPHESEGPSDEDNQASPRGRVGAEKDKGDDNDADEDSDNDDDSDDAKDDDDSDDDADEDNDDDEDDEESKD
jgi:small subunit ribosomal protein S6